MLLRSEGLEDNVVEITKVLGHYEVLFYDNDEGLQSIFDIAEVLVNRL